MIIISTIGKNDTFEKSKKMILAGADIVRFNLSKYRITENIEIIKIVHGLIDEFSSKAKTMVDMPINKIQIGDFGEESYQINEGDEFICKSATFSKNCQDYIPIDTDQIGSKVKEGQIVAIGDGEIAFQVTNIIDLDTIKIRVTNNGVIKHWKNLNIRENNKEKYLENFQKIIDQISEFTPDYIAISYLDKETNEKIKKIIKEKKESNKLKKVVLKIEDDFVVKNIDEIMKDDFFDLYILDRGELGVNIPMEELGMVQETTLKAAEKNKKRVIVSTQILDSTINNLIPSRAEIIDLTNMVIKKVYGILLCNETEKNTRPAYTISIAKKIINKVEKNQKK